MRRYATMWRRNSAEVSSVRPACGRYAHGAEPLPQQRQRPLHVDGIGDVLVLERLHAQRRQLAQTRRRNEERYVWLAA